MGERKSEVQSDLGKEKPGPRLIEMCRRDN